MPPAPASSVVTTASSMSSSSSDISLPSSPPSSPSADPFEFASEDEISAAPLAKKRKPPNRGGAMGPLRTWPAADELVFLEAVAALREQHGRLPNRAELTAALAGPLPHVSPEQAASRLSSLRQRYEASVRRLRRGTVPVTDDDVRVFRLSKRIWEGVPRRGRRARAVPHHERRAFAVLQEMYPCLAADVEAIDAKHGRTGMVRGAFERIGDEQAAALEAKIRRQRIAQMKADAGRAEIRSMVATAILDSMEE